MCTGSDEMLVQLSELLPVEASAAGVFFSGSPGGIGLADNGAVASGLTAGWVAFVDGSERLGVTISVVNALAW